MPKLDSENHLAKAGADHSAVCRSMSTGLALLGFQDNLKLSCDVDYSRFKWE